MILDFCYYIFMNKFIEVVIWIVGIWLGVLLIKEYILPDIVYIIQALILLGIAVGFPVLLDKYFNMHWGFAIPIVVIALYFVWDAFDQYNNLGSHYYYY